MRPSTRPTGATSSFAEPDGDSAILSVCDNGVGISQEMLPRVFDLFVQGEAGHNRDEGGLGIGLALARKISEMHGGSVRAESAGENRGSEFTVTLPLEQPAAKQFQDARVNSSRPDPIAGGLRPSGRIRAGVDPGYSQ